MLVGFYTFYDSSQQRGNLLSYITLYKKFNSTKNIKQKRIQTNNLVITQLIIEKSNLISFKNIFMNKNDKIVQFDFSIQQKDYENNNVDSNWDKN